MKKSELGANHSVVGIVLFINVISTTAKHYASDENLHHFTGSVLKPSYHPIFREDLKKKFATEELRFLRFSELYSYPAH